MSPPFRNGIAETTRDAVGDSAIGEVVEIREGRFSPAPVGEDLAGHQSIEAIESISDVLRGDELAKGDTRPCPIQRLGCGIGRNPRPDLGRQRRGAAARWRP